MSGKKKQARGGPDKASLLRQLHRVDVAFVVDTTGSMGSFIAAAQKELLAAVDRLASAASVDLQVGLVQYRDHPPQDTSFVTRVFDLTGKLKAVQREIKRFKADGGGDAPEAVFDGMHDACTRLSWREGSCRYGFLVGDAPPHGVAARYAAELSSDDDRGEEPPARGRGRGGRGRERGRGGGRRPAAVYPYADSFAGGCPCGLDTRAVTAAAEQARVTFHAIYMHAHPCTQRAFSELAAGTGGRCSFSDRADQVVGWLVETLQEELSELPFDAKVLATIHELGELDLEAASATLGVPRAKLAPAVGRLGRRGLLDAVVTL